MTRARVRDISDADFEQAVIGRSREVPVLVDFWAPWCGPCRMLGPVLEKLAEERGDFELVKVNTDENPAVAGSLGVRGIPHVVLFKDGRPAGQFVGALPEDRVRAFLHEHCPSPADQRVAEGQRRLLAGDEEGARRAFEQAVAAAPQHGGAHLGLARLALRMRELDAVREHVQRIPPQAEEREPGEHLEQAASLIAAASAAGDQAGVQARLDADPGDIEARFALGAHHLAAGRYRDALDAFLAVVERDRKWHEEAGRKAMLTVFGVVGVRDPLASEYRRKLMIYT